METENDLCVARRSDSLLARFSLSTLNVWRDRELVTGQNPASPIEFGEAFVRVVQDFQQSGRLN
jgi:hypothetical protein